VIKKVSLELEGGNEFQSIASSHNTKLDVIECKDNGVGTTMLLSVSGRSRDVRGVIYDIGKLSFVKKVYPAKVSSSSSLCIIVTDRPPLCQAMLEADVMCLTCPYNEKDERVRWEILIRSSDSLKRLTDVLKNVGMELRVKGISGLAKNGGLTPRQKEIVAKAISLGYFDFPRRVSLTSLSGTLGIKPSTLSEILRSAERKIIIGYGEALRAPRSHFQAGLSE
jgi:predicted DNA binding protein